LTLLARAGFVHRIVVVFIPRNKKRSKEQRRRSLIATTTNNKTNESMGNKVSSSNEAEPPAAEEEAVATESQPLLAKMATTDVEAGPDDENAKPVGTEGTSVLDDVIEISQLAFPIFITSFSWVGVSTCSI
jgi:hypothetical protein